MVIHVVLRYVVQAPLQGGVEAAEIVKSEALQNKMLIHYLQHEVAKFKVFQVVKVKDLGYIVNTESAVVHKSRWCRLWAL